MDELNLVITNETTIFKKIKKEILNCKEKINPKRLKDFLDESEMNVLEIKLNAVIEILENRKQNIKNVIDYLNESKSGLLNLHNRYYGKLSKELMDLHIEKAFSKSLKEIRKELKIH